MKINGADAVMRCLEAEGVDYVFGHPGGAILPIYDAIFKSPKIRHVLVRHEQAGAHMADGFARATGRVGVCMGTSGPGATNLVTGIATAHMDSIPMVAITGNVPSNLIGTDAFQEADIFGITVPVVKHNYLVTDPKDIPRVFKEAFHIARTGRPGPVLVDLPKDHALAEIEWNGYPDSVDLPGYRPRTEGHPVQAKKAAQVIAESQRPVMYIGGGVVAANAAPELLELAELVGAPVLNTLMGKGAFPDTHKQSLRMLGMHGARYANFSIQQSDLIIAVGVRFDDRVTGKLVKFAPQAKVIHIDIDPAEIGKNRVPLVPIVGDCKSVLPMLTREVRKVFAEKRPDISAWWKQIEVWKEKHPLRYKQETGGPMLPQFVADTLDKLTRGKAVVATGVGEHQMFAAQYLRADKPRQFITSGGLGTMGFCVPAAIGAQLGRPGELVIGIDGDGSFQMTNQDLATATLLKIPVKIFILNNGCLGMVRQWQELFYSKRESEVHLGPYPDFVKLAEAYGGVGLRATRPEELEDVIVRALAEKERPVVVDCRIKEDECCYPMVPAGAALDEMIGGE